MRIKIHPSFGIYLLCIALLSSYSDCFAVLLVLIVHELCHYAVARSMGEQIDLLELTPFGGVMKYRAGYSSKKGLQGIAIHSAGPLGNYAFLLFVSNIAIQNSFYPAFRRSLIHANCSMLLINLLPVLPLDGGSIVFCIGYYLFPIYKLVTILCASGMAAGCIGVLLSAYGLVVHKMLNCSLLIVSLYLTISAYSSKKQILCENIFAVLQEHQETSAKIKRILSYRVKSDIVLLDLIPLLKRDSSIHIVFNDGECSYELSENALLRALLTMPSATIKEAHMEFS